MPLALGEVVDCNLVIKCRASSYRTELALSVGLPLVCSAVIARHRGGLRTRADVLDVGAPASSVGEFRREEELLGAGDRSHLG